MEADNPRGGSRERIQRATGRGKDGGKGTKKRGKRKAPATFRRLSLTRARASRLRAGSGEASRGLFRVIKSMELFSRLSPASGNLKRGRETKRRRETRRRKRRTPDAQKERRWDPCRGGGNEVVPPRGKAGEARRGKEVEAVIKRVSCRSPN